MHDGIGPTLREARNRRKLDLIEVEAATKIRLRYLRAMENDEWDVLPGGPYTRAFIRTYGAFLGLDGERLVDEYRRTASEEAERPGRPETPGLALPSMPVRRRLGGRAVAVAASILAVVALVAIGMFGGGGGGSSAPRTGGKKSRSTGGGDGRAVAAKPGVTLTLTATGEVWVCLLDTTGEPVMNGVILEAGKSAGPFRSAGFTAAFGNGAIELAIDGKRAKTPPSAGPVAYAIDSGGALTPLASGERPNC